MPPTANELLFDSSVRHHVGIRRLASGEVREALAVLEEADRELSETLRERLARLGKLGLAAFTTQRFVRMLRDVRALRKVAMAEVRGKVRQDLLELAAVEAGFEARMIKAAVPFEVDLASVPASQLRAVVTSKPFQGRLLRQWFQSLEASDRRGLEQAIRLGIVQGETVPQVVRRVAGTRAQGFRDGVLATTRRRAEAVVRTAVNHVSNAAREELWEENEDIIQALRWTSTLDGRTSAVCRRRDGKLVKVAEKPLPEGSQLLDPQGARPPAHVGCRSLMISIIDGVGVIGDRPFVRDTRTRARREVDFRKMAQNQGKSIQRVRREWADENIGQVPAEVTYGQWLRRQPAAFQDQVLGKTKGALFRRGGLQVEQFVDRKGSELTLEQLKNTHPEAFVQADVEV